MALKINGNTEFSECQLSQEICPQRPSKQYTKLLWMKQICMAYEHLHVLH